MVLHPRDAHPKMENRQRNAFGAAFQLNAIDLAGTEGKIEPLQKLGINESMGRDSSGENCLNAERRQKLQREETPVART